LKAYNLPMIGTCKHCGLIFEVKLIHNGFNYSSYAYCDTCGITALLSGWAKRWPQGVEFIQAEIPVEMEAHLAALHLWRKIHQRERTTMPELPPAN